MLQRYVASRPGTWQYCARIFFGGFRGGRFFFDKIWAYETITGSVPDSYRVWDVPDGVGGFGIRPNRS